MYRPVKSNYLAQDFGENKACCKADERGLPIRPFVIQSTSTDGVCPIGYMSFYPSIGMKGHNGKDWKSWHGEPVYFPCEFDGWLRHASDLDGGIGVDIISNGQILRDENGNLQYIKWRGWHGLKVTGVEGQKIKMGDLVMLADSTGASSGDHLHESLKWCDQYGNGIKQDNGYQGAIPPKFFEQENIFVGERVEIVKKAMSAIDYARQFISWLQAYILEIKK